MELKIPTPRNFSFRRTVASHGWYQLPPFALDITKWELSRVIDVGQKPPVTIFVTERKTHIRVTASRSMTTSTRSISPWKTIRSFRGSAYKAPDGCYVPQPSTKISSK